jgi:adenine-specific DNA-methyltransferase
MLDLIISTSSNQGSIVLDCFCGSGTTLISAQSLGRYWIGIDKSEIAIATTKKKLEQIQPDLFSDKSIYREIKL